MMIEHENRILHGDAVSELARLPDESVHLFVTSPSYFDPKDYDSADQLGYGETLGEYLANLREVWRESSDVRHFRSHDRHHLSYSVT